MANFSDALKELRKGKAVKRLAWNNTQPDLYIAYDVSRTKLMYFNGEEACEYVEIPQEFLLADDWVILVSKGD